ncbi:MAG: two pore domain potassium channel family protein [Cytophagales bacterium]|nr:two pore domain potassium channel family protein [Armatimonadota bacterium]
MSTLAAISLNTLAVLGSLALIAFIMLEAFETLLLPRRIERPLRLTGFFYRTLWFVWKRLSYVSSVSGRDNFLAIFGPFSLLLLLNCWALGLILAFAILQAGLHLPIHAPEAQPTFATYFYLSATTFITLGFGDVSPLTTAGRLIADLEAGLGFGFLAIVIGYLPVLYAAFSRREVEIALLDARASSPPSAGALLERIAVCPEAADLKEMLQGYERWAAEVIESHLSYPVLMFYRSQHDRQSWLSALTAILDTCAFVLAKVPDGPQWQARMTFAMARHTAVDLALVFDTPPRSPDPDRLPPERQERLSAMLREAGLNVLRTPESDRRLQELRFLYEPFVDSLSKSLLLPLPPWLPNRDLPDNWQTSAWDRGDHFFQVPAVGSAEVGLSPRAEV